MNIAIYTHDLTVDNTHLMPWRTVLEVARHIGDRVDCKAVILSGSNKAESSRSEINNVHVCAVPKPNTGNDINTISKICCHKKVDVLYYPLCWRLPLKKVQLIEKKANLKIVWYVPGAWYGLSSVLKAILHMGFRDTLPYLLQSLVPRKLFVKCLIKDRVRPLITMTNYNRDKLIECGYPENMITTIPPGKAPLSVMGENTVLSSRLLSKNAGRPYFLFFGPPQPIRGIYQIIKAFPIVAAKNKDVCLICLFRKDDGLKSSLVQKKISEIDFSDRVFCYWESVSEADIDALLKQCYAVLKPFLLVPSEIPLALIEAAGYGKPIIGAGPDGTGSFAEKVGMMVPAGNSRKLASAMNIMLNDTCFYDSKCNSSANVYQAHPTWEEAAKKWLSAAKTYQEVDS